MKLIGKLKYFNINSKPLTKQAIQHQKYLIIFILCFCGLCPSIINYFNASFYQEYHNFFLSFFLGFGIYQFYMWFMLQEVSDKKDLEMIYKLCKQDPLLLKYFELIEKVERVPVKGELKAILKFIKNK